MENQTRSKTSCTNPQSHQQPEVLPPPEYRQNDVILTQCMNHQNWTTTALPHPDMNKLSETQFAQKVVLLPPYNDDSAIPTYLGMVPRESGYQGRPGPHYGSDQFPEPAIMIKQQAPEVHQPQDERYWSTGLLSCFNDWTSCFLGTFFPWCLAMTIACSMNESCCAGCCYPVAVRTKLRTQQNITGSVCEDAFVLCWCYQCGLCQMAREIDAIMLKQAED